MTCIVVGQLIVPGYRQFYKIATRGPNIMHRVPCGSKFFLFLSFLIDSSTRISRVLREYDHVTNSGGDDVAQTTCYGSKIFICDHINMKRGGDDVVRTCSK